MPTSNLRLAEPPLDPRQRQLWLQHAAGLILFEDVRSYALDQLNESLSDSERAVAKSAIDHSLYGLMQVIDGVTGGLRREHWSVDMGFNVCLHHDGQLATSLDLIAGDGMCMGYHGWIAGDFGSVPVVDA